MTDKKIKSLKCKRRRERSGLYAIPYIYLDNYTTSDIRKNFIKHKKTLYGFKHPYRTDECVINMSQYVK